MNQPASINAPHAATTTAAAGRALPLPLTVRRDPAELEALWAMSKQQRIDAMWACQLTLSQLCDWSSRRPSEVPKLAGEFAWLVMHTPEWDEPREQPDNVIPLPKRGEHRAAA